MRHLQMVNIYGTKIIYTGTSPATLNAVAGEVPQKTWLDVSNDIDDITKVRLGWSSMRDDSGAVSGGAGGSTGNFTKRTSSGTIKVNSTAYAFIKAWCIDHVSAPFNAIEVKIQTDCGTFERYKISSDQISWCEGEFICEFDITLNQVDPAIQCIQKTVVSDNHQGWFQSIPAGGKKHPRFSYCNEARPNSILVGLWYLVAILTPVIVLLFALYFVILIVINIINIIIGVISTIASLLGIGGVDEPEWNAIPEYKLTDFITSLELLLVESAGCGREHPAPLIRDYITNVCNKCGITVDAITAPIFFSPTWNVDLVTSTGQNLRGQPNPYFNACYLNAPVTKGVRRFQNINFFGPTAEQDLETFYLTGNRVGLALNDFLDEIKLVWNAEWRIKNGKLYFWRKDWYKDGAVLLNFSKGTADRAKILEGVCYEWNEVKMPAYTEGLWSKDGVDQAGDTSLGQMNGLGGKGLIAHGKTENNPLFSGKQSKMVQFGGTRFRFDGSGGDYIYDAMQTVLSITIAAPWVPPMMRKIDTWISDYSNYALLLSGDTCALPKIIIWDGGSYVSAKSTLGVVPVNNILAPTEKVPSINAKYNEGLQQWLAMHPPQTRVLSTRATPGGIPFGVYKVQTFYGSLVAQNAARLVNYPMYFEPNFQGTLWDLFHFIDDPRINPKLNLNFDVKIELCCEYVERLKLLGDGSEAELGAKVVLDLPFYPNGAITEIEMNTDPDDKLGPYLHIKGTA